MTIVAVAQTLTPAQGLEIVRGYAQTDDAEISYLVDALFEEAESDGFDLSAYEQQVADAFAEHAAYDLSWQIESDPEMRYEVTQALRLAAIAQARRHTLTQGAWRQLAGPVAEVVGIR